MSGIQTGTCERLSTTFALQTLTPSTTSAKIPLPESRYRAAAHPGWTATFVPQGPRQRARHPSLSLADSCLGGWVGGMGRVGRGMRAFLRNSDLEPPPMEIG